MAYGWALVFTVFLQNLVRLRIYDEIRGIGSFSRMRGNQLLEIVDYISEYNVLSQGMENPSLYQRPISIHTKLNNPTRHSPRPRQKVSVVSARERGFYFDAHLPFLCHQDELTLQQRSSPLKQPSTRRLVKVHPEMQQLGES